MSPNGPLPAADLTDDLAADLTEPAVEFVSRLLQRAEELENDDDRATMATLEDVITDPDGVRFVMAFVDRVIRPDDDRVAAGQLASVVAGEPQSTGSQSNGSQSTDSQANGSLPGFLSVIDRQLLRIGARVAPVLPRIVMPLARRRMRAIVGHLVAPADRHGLADHLATKRGAGYSLNVNLLGEAVLGEREAKRRLDELLLLLQQPDVDYVSVKISAVASQLNHWAHADSLRRVEDRLSLLFEAAGRTDTGTASTGASKPTTFINVDMEEYHDLGLTLEAFMNVLGTEERRHLDAGIVLQAYLPDALPALQTLAQWANRRHLDGGGTIKVRLVKGANLAMERVDAAMHGWEQAPFESKVEADANYKRCLDWLLTPARMQGLRLGLASHNLFDVAWTHLLAEKRGVADRVQFEMLQGMAPAQAKSVAEIADPASPVLLYTPAVRSEDFDVAISYLFRRLEENASEDNFLRHLFDLKPDSPQFQEQADIFRRSVEIRHQLPTGPRRTQNRLEPSSAAYQVGEPFRNEPETDPTLPANLTWIADTMKREPEPVATPIFDSVEQIEQCLERARAAAKSWGNSPVTERQELLHRVGDELAERRGELIATMMSEGNKTFVEADGEVAEAIDFARYYADRAAELNPELGSKSGSESSSEVSRESTWAGARFEPFGVVAVIPPWNFPVAIPAGGVLAALAAGNAVVFKPAPETPRCAEIVAEACWQAGVDQSVLQFVRTPDNEVGQALVTGADAVILTGSTETADLFRSWKPDLRLFAETSGKNALIITPNADMDLAVADLVRSAFGHSGQKCSAASLAIVVGETYYSERFRRQLADAVESMDLGEANRIETTMGPLIGPANDRLEWALTTLMPGETWLVEPGRLPSENPSSDSHLWSPGVRFGVEPGSWFHETECFGPVLGIMHAKTLDEAIEIQNSSAYGLTGGIHSLDPAEIETWLDRVEVGNAYVNRHITGAIVQRQPFGGWKRSSIGPGAKAGGPNYVSQLGTWHSNEQQHGDSSAEDFAQAWAEHFSVEHDPTGLFCEQNAFRYRPLPAVVLRYGPEAEPEALRLARRAAATCGVTLLESSTEQETDQALIARLPSLTATDGVERLRTVGAHASDELQRAANDLGVFIDRAPVTAIGRLELQHYLREQAISRTLHRFGNLVGDTRS